MKNKSSMELLLEFMQSNNLLSCRTIGHQEGYCIEVEITKIDEDDENDDDDFVE